MVAYTEAPFQVWETTEGISWTPSPAGTPDAEACYVERTGAGNITFFFSTKCPNQTRQNTMWILSLEPTN